MLIFGRDFRRKRTIATATHARVGLTARTSEKEVPPRLTASAEWRTAGRGKREKEGRRVRAHRCQTPFLRRPSFSLFFHPRRHPSFRQRRQELAEPPPIKDNFSQNELSLACEAWVTSTLKPFQRQRYNHPSCESKKESCFQHHKSQITNHKANFDGKDTTRGTLCRFLMTYQTSIKIPHSCNQAVTTKKRWVLSEWVPQLDLSQHDWTMIL